MSTYVVVGLGPWREDLLVVFLFARAIESDGMGCGGCGCAGRFRKRTRWKIADGGDFCFLRDYVEMRSVAGMNAARQIGFYEANHDLWIPCF